MATWQYEIMLLPSWTNDQRWTAINESVMPDDFDFASLWERYERKEALRASLSLLLPPGNSWAPEIQVWGEADGDRICVVSHEDTFNEIIIRFDVRNISYEFIRSVVDVAKKFDLVILTDKMQVLEPNYYGLLNTIKLSGAARFVRDPMAFLDTLEKGRS